jgi:hypothetical protein
VTASGGTTDAPEIFDAWAVVHLFGRHTVAGKVTEQKLAGRDFLRVDVPQVDGHQARTIFYNPEAVYDLEPTDEEAARMAAAAHQPAEPVSTWSARRLLGVGTSQLALGTPDPDGDGDGDEDPYADDDEPI